jgi:hypothetical protein
MRTDSGLENEKGGKGGVWGGGGGGGGSPAFWSEKLGLVPTLALYPALKSVAPQVFSTQLCTQE